MLVVYMMVYFQRVSPGAIAGQLMHDINVNATQLGIISSSYFLFYALMQPIVGFLADKFGPKKVILVSFIASIFATLSFSFVDGFYSALIARSITGITTGGLLIPSLKLLAEWFAPEKFARVNGLFLGLGGAGGAFLATIPLSYMDLMLGWRNVFILFSALGIFVALMVFMFVRDKVKQQPVNQSEPASNLDYFGVIKNLILSKDFIVMELIFFISFGVYLSFQGLWATKYLTSVMYISPQVANSIIFFLPLGYLFGAPLGGYVADKIFHSTIIPIKIALVALVFSWFQLTFFASVSPSILIMLVFLVVGLAIGSIPPLVFATIKQMVPPEAMGLSIGLSNPAIFIGTFAFQLITGMMLDMFRIGDHYTADTYFVMMLFCSVSLLIVTILSMKLNNRMTEPVDLTPRQVIVNLRKWSYELISQTVHHIKTVAGKNRQYVYLKYLSKK